LEDRDLSRSDQFQQAVSELVALLGKLPQSAVRSRYLQQVAERLAGGQARLALQLEQDLRQQVQGQRWHGRSARWEQPEQASQRERAEAELLRLYLHCPVWRATIRAELRRRELDDFALQPHRLLWARIGEIEEDHLGSQRLEAINRGSDPGQELALLELPQLLSDRLLLEEGDLAPRLTPLLEPSELQRITLAQPQLQLRGAAASLERLRCLRRCRHLLEAWKSQRLITIETCLARLIAALADQESAASAGQEEPPLDHAAGTGPDLSNLDGNGLVRALPPAPLPEAPLPEAPLMDMEQRIEALFHELNADALRFQADYYNERRCLEHLDLQRCAGFELSAALPAA
jgi:DNA primase